MSYDFDRNFEAKQARRMHSQDRFLSRLEKREAAAEQMVGELNGGKFYINVRNKAGVLTGKTVEFSCYGAAVAYLIRNNYV